MCNLLTYKLRKRYRYFQDYITFNEVMALWVKYSMPTQIYLVKMVFKNKEVFSKIGSKALIVTGRRSAKENGSYDDVKKALLETGMEYVLYDEVEENPSLETIEKASNIGKDYNVDFVIGIGGGSPMDATKAIAVFIKPQN